MSKVSVPKPPYSGESAFYRFRKTLGLVRKPSMRPEGPVSANFSWITTPRIVYAAVGLYLLTEFFVSGSWDGHYSYIKNFASDLGVPFCGPKGKDPCSITHVLMNVAFIVLGLAISYSAVHWFIKGVLSLSQTLLLAVGGLGQILVGAVKENEIWSVHSFGASVLMLFVSIGCLVISIDMMPYGDRGLWTFELIVSLIALIAYFNYHYHWLHKWGSGLSERLVIYPLLIIIVLLQHLLASKEIQWKKEQRLRSKVILA